MEVAQALALEEYEKFNKRRLADEARREALADNGFDEIARLIESHAKKRKALAAGGKPGGKNRRISSIFKGGQNGENQD